MLETELVLGLLLVQIGERITPARELRVHIAGQIEELWIGGGERDGGAVELGEVANFGRSQV